jgi:uncharacterized protein
MESQKLCAYNQTRECFLGLEVTAADLSYANVKTRMATLSFKSGEGLWMVPFRGMPESGMHIPFDLIYLDEDCRVVDLVESFPTFRASSSGPTPASVLVLPTHSVYSSQTQLGDQLVICVAEEMERRLERFSGASGVAGAVRSAALLRQAPLWSGGPGLLQLENRSRRGADPDFQQMHEMDLSPTGHEGSQASQNLVGSLVVSGSQEGAAGAGVRLGRLLLDRIGSGAARHQEHQFDGPVPGHRGALVPRHPHPDDAGQKGLRRVR